jgi:hypothetical protein
MPLMLSIYLTIALVLSMLDTISWCTTYVRTLQSPYYKHTRRHRDEAHSLCAWMTLRHFGLQELQFEA